MAAEGGLDPIHQFVIAPVFHIGPLPVTNSAVFMIAILAVASFIMIIGTSSRALVPGRLQSLGEVAYEFVASTVRGSAGQDGMRFFPMVFSLFMFVLLSNLIGIIPYTFTVTSHIIVTFVMAFFIFIGVTLIGLARHKLHFFSLFLPPGLPIYLAPLLIPIEIIGYLTRPISLSVRLAANMMAGHTMVEVFAGFIVALGIFGFAPFLFVTAVYGLEVVVAFLQAYVFAVLTCLYLSDAINLHKH